MLNSKSSFLRIIVHAQSDKKEMEKEEGEEAVMMLLLFTCND